MSSRPQQLNDFITKRKPNFLCNKCIAEAVGLSNVGAHPAQITATLGTTTDFKQKRDRCSICHEIKLVIRRV